MRNTDKMFFISILGFMGGVAIRSFFETGVTFIYFLFLVVAVLSPIYFLSSHRSVIPVLLIVLSVILGITRFELADDALQTFLETQQFLGEDVVVEGVVIDEPDVRETTSMLVVAVDTIVTTKGVYSNVRAKIRVTLRRYPVFMYGDRIRLSGKLDVPRNFTNDKTGKEFDYVSYLGKDNIFYVMYFPEAVRISSGGGNLVKRMLFSLKQSFLDTVGEIFPEPHASLLSGLVVGAKQSLGDAVLEKFRTTGIVHIVVLSGYNVTIVAESLMRFFSFLPRVASLWVGAGTIVLFAIMVGAGATVVRASVMALLVILARATGRTYEVLRALLVAATVMVFFNPKILLFDISFQLSFLATLGIILLPPIIEKHFHFIPAKFQLRELALATASTQIFVLPLLLYKIGELSLVALPVNLLVLAFIPLTMLFGFLAGVSGVIHPILAIPFAAVAYALLAYELAVVNLFAALPFAAIQIEQFPLWLMWGMYGVYGWVVWRFWGIRNRKDARLLN